MMTTLKRSTPGINEDDIATTILLRRSRKSIKQSERPTQTYIINNATEQQPRQRQTMQGRMAVSGNKINIFFRKRCSAHVPD